MRGLLIISVAVVLAVASANCPNSCSGHGTCGANDLCKCYPNFKGLDCSERVCPYQVAFSDVASAANTAHAYMECSGKGLCDRKSGTCKCFAGYEGDACRRTSCPNLCSGHGTCELMDEATTYSYTTWEAKKHQVCVCDAYWHGVDCSERDCPKGDDPLTTTNVANEVQTVTVGDGDDYATNAMTGSFTLTFTDQFNGVWTTRPITGTDNNGVTPTLLHTAAEMQSALNGLPNEVISGATVTAAASSNDVVYTITFGSLNSGSQNLLTCNFAGCTVDGCQPRFTGIGGGPTPACAVARTTTGNKEKTTCSSRGSCDEVTGKCVCFSGYYGEACQMQTALF